MLIYFAASVAAALKTLQRECLTCHYKQVAPPSKKNQIVRCEKCGAEIAPKPIIRE